MLYFSKVDITQISLANMLDLNLPTPAIGMASDPMARRRGGRALAMEDVALLQYPLLRAGKVCLLN
jgi:hypothetical protein